MVYVDMTKQSGRTLTPGIDLWEVMSIEAGTSSAGDPKLEPKFRRVSNHADHMYDTIMLDGPGWDIGRPKMDALGVPETHKGDLDELGLIGKRVWIYTGVDTYKGKDKLKPLIEELTHKGYQPLADVPVGCVMPDEPDDGPVPF